MNASTKPSQLAAPDALMLQPQDANEHSQLTASARARTLMEGRFLMALKYPRDIEVVRQKLLKECSRPVFADSKRTYYIKPIGDGVHGLGIGFVEAAIAAMRNILVETEMRFNSPDLEIQMVTVTDLEGSTYSIETPIEKTVERSAPLSDGSFISQRKNSNGRTAYLVRANEDDMLNKRGSHISKAIRTQGLRLIPQWLKQECIDTIMKVREDRAALDPDGERRRIIDSFANLNVTAADLVAFVGHDLGQCSPKQLVWLRGIYDAIDTGESTWAEVLENKEQQRQEGTGKKNTVAPASTVKTKAQAAAEATGPETGGQPAEAAASTSPTGPVDKGTGEIAAGGANKAAASAPAPAAATTTANQPLASEGERKWLMNKCKGDPKRLQVALNEVGYTMLNSLSPQELASVVEQSDPKMLAGLTSAQFNDARPHVK